MVLVAARAGARHESKKPSQLRHALPVAARWSQHCRAAQRRNLQPLQTSIQALPKTWQFYIGPFGEKHGQMVVRAGLGTVGSLSFGPIKNMYYVFCDLSACTIH